LEATGWKQMQGVRGGETVEARQANLWGEARRGERSGDEILKVKWSRYFI
jgi:hypothetical protein